LLAQDLVVAFQAVAAMQINITLRQVKTHAMECKAVLTIQIFNMLETIHAMGKTVVDSLAQI